MHIRLALQVLIKRIKAIKYMMHDSDVPKRKKALVVFGIIFLFLPLGIIPPVLFPIGLIDDIILWVWILWHLRDTLDRYWNGGSSVDYSKKYPHTIDTDDYEVRYDRDKNGKKKEREKGNKEHGCEDDDPDSKN